MSELAQAGRFGSGQAIARLEDPALLSGSGRYTDDIELANQHHMVFLRSPFAHATIDAVDLTAAEKVAGVVAVYCGRKLQQAGVKPLPSVAEGFKRGDGSPALSATRWPLALDKVYYAGQPVCAVVAESVASAIQACEAIQVDYTPLPVVASLQKALAEDAPVIADDATDNISAEMRHGDAEAAAAAFAGAAHRVSLKLENQRLAPSPIEPRSVVAHNDADGRLCVRLSSQMPTAVRNTLASPVLGMEPSDIRVLVGDVGGGFGMKTGLYAEDAVVAFGARQTGLPVKWVATRSEELLSANHGRDLHTFAELALDADGRVLAYRNRSDADIGALAVATGIAIQLLIGPWVATSVYDIPVIDFHFRAVLTNRTATGAYRGAGRPEAIYTIERLMDEAARVTGIDAAEIRRRNLITPGQMPYTNPMAQTYDCGNFESILDQAIELADRANFDNRYRTSAAAGKLRGQGLVSFLEWTGGTVFEESVTIDVLGDGTVSIATALLPMGQGIATCFAQVVSAELGVPVEQIIVRHGDTDHLNGFGSAGSRSLFTGGSALQVASVELIEKAKSMAAEHFECAPGDIQYSTEGQSEKSVKDSISAEFRVVGTDKTIGLFELAALQDGQLIDIASTSSCDDSTWPNGCHSCEVEIDPETGVVEVVRYDNVNDIGNVVNPLIVTGQLEGGALQGIGQALCEAIIYDEDNGQLQTGSLLDYTLPRADNTPFCTTRLDTSIPCTNNRLGVKGVGELGTIGATPAVVSAVVDALLRAGADPVDVLKMQMPFTSAKVWQVLRNAAPQ
ncbi:carbon monoxide dehydrogenase [Chromatiales bacterium (ex Bugula neritina AB1)]|nr:carbon monoxide dehydrogenase [Chromatiales bacterium (ex Bugula neritina AB1)]